MTVTLDVPTDWEAELEAAARRHGKDVTEFLRDSIRQQLHRDVLPEADTDLLTTINAQVDPQVRKQRDDLLELQSERDLTDAEREALTEAIDAVELVNARRWQAIAELATRGGLSFPEIARELQIPLP